MSGLKNRQSREMLADMQDEIKDAKLELFRFFDGKMDDMEGKSTTDGVNRIEKMSSEKPNHMSTEKVKDEEEKYTDEVKDEEKDGFSDFGRVKLPRAMARLLSAARYLLLRRKVKKSLSPQEPTTRRRRLDYGGRIRNHQ